MVTYEKRLLFVYIGTNMRLYILFLLILSIEHACKSVKKPALSIILKKSKRVFTKKKKSKRGPSNFEREESL